MGKIFININKGDVEMSANVTTSELVIATGTLIHEMIFHLNEEYGMKEEIKKVLCDNINSEELDADLIKIALSLKDKVNEDMDKLEVSSALEHIFDLFRACNKYIDETMPWVLAKDDTKRDRLATVLYNLIESIRIATVLLQAFIPDTADKIFYQINTDLKGYDTIDNFGGYVSGTKVNNPEVLFKRIEN